MKDWREIIETGLKRAGYDASFKARALRGDASVRRYFRLELEEPGKSFPTKTTVAMLLPPGSGETFGLIADTQNFFRGLGAAVPDFIAADKELGLFLMEDLGTTDMEALLLAGPGAQETEKLYRAAIDILLRLQSADCRPENKPGFKPFALAFDRGKLLWELDFFVENYIEALKGKSLPAAQRRELGTCFGKLCAELESQPRVLCHRDYHCRNLIFKDSRLRVIDFQDARMGPRQYDLASLLRDSYFPIADDMRERLINYFIDSLDAQTGQKTDRTEFLRVFELTAVQRNLKALGTFGFMLAKAGKEHFRSAVAPTVTYIKDAPDNIAVIAKIKSLLLPLL